METSNPKHEIRNSKKSLTSKIQTIEQTSHDFVSVIGYSGFEFVSGFDIRISDLVNANSVNHVPWV